MSDDAVSLDDLDRAVPRSRSKRRSRFIVPGDDDPRHGTMNGYTNLSCRCFLCRNAMRDYVRQYRKTHFISS